jgi:hypothetical protein
MIKKPTLILLLLAILAGAAAYWFDWKRGQKEDAKTPEESGKPAFTITPDQITSIAISRVGEPAESAIHLGKRNAEWQITQPVQTLADAPTAEGLVDSLAAARIAQTEPGTPDQLKSYGLTPPVVTIEFQTQNGVNHSIKLGKKDFTGASVYSQIDGAKDVALLPEALLTSSEKSLNDFRDRTVLSVRPAQVVSINLRNSGGEVALSEDKDVWKFTKPPGATADRSAIDGLLSSISSAKISSVVGETADDLLKYGLAAPAITFSAADAKGKTATLLVGKKDGDVYFARDSGRPMIFTIGEDLYKKLSQNFSDLRDKRLVRFDPSTITHMDIQGADGSISCTRKNEDEWAFDAPAEMKGKPASGEKVFGPLGRARAEQVIDNPPASLNAKFTRPAFEAVFTSKDGKKLTVAVSKDSDGFVYGRTSDGPTVYKFKKQILDDLTFKPADMAF